MRLMLLLVLSCILLTCCDYNVVRVSHQKADNHSTISSQDPQNTDQSTRVKIDAKATLK